jgi:hypothetical protein
MGRNETPTIEINRPTIGINRLISPPFSIFLALTVKRKIALNEVIAKYEKAGFKRLSHVGYWKHARKLIAQGKLSAVKHEQLFLMPSMDSEKINHATIEPRTGERLTGTIEPIRREINQPTIERAHSTHRILLSMPYQGEQPEAGASAIKPFGRYGTARQVIYKHGDLTIIAYRKKLNVWVHKPKGARTQEQLIAAKVQGYRALVSFARSHTLTLEGYLNKVLYSHHVVENEALNAAIKDLIEAYPEIEQRLGSKVCNTSHKGKVEHEGKARADRIIRGDMVAAGLEYLTLDYPKDFAEFARDAVPALTEQIRLHLKVQEETLAYLKAINAAIKEKGGKIE